MYEKQRDLVSIIVPVYNVEKYLEKCLDSLIKQTYRNLQIILVDDGSRDSSGTICDRYAAQDNRIQVIHKKQSGVSAARNTGLEAVKGSYICFADSDDWSDEKMIETMYENMVEEKAQISIIGYDMVWEDGRCQKKSDENAYYVWNQREAIAQWMTQKIFKGFMCDKMFAKEIFTGIRFPEDRSYMEDVAIGLNLFAKAETVVYSGKIGYHYLQRQGSATNSGFQERELLGITEAEKMIRFSKDHQGGYDKEAYSRLLINVYTILERIVLTGNKKDKEKIPELKKVLREYRGYLKGGAVNRYTQPFVKLICIGIPPAITVKARQVLIELKRIF